MDLERNCNATNLIPQDEEPTKLRLQHVTVIQEARMYIAHVSTIPFKAFNLMFPYLQHIGLNIEDCIGEQAYSYIIVRCPGHTKTKSVTGVD